MRTFFDEENREWKLRLTFKKAKEIHERCERPDSTQRARKTYDFFNITDKEQVEYLSYNDPLTGRFNLETAERLVNILYVLCEEQCKEREMSAEQFGEMLGDGLFGKAWAAFQEELVNFIPDPTCKEMYQNLMYLAVGTQQAALSEANRILTETRTALDAHVHQRVLEASEMVKQAIKELDETPVKAVVDSGTTNSSNSSGLPGLSPTTSPQGKS